MISDVKLCERDASMRTILSILSDGNPTPQMLYPGLFVCGHWNFEQYLPDGFDPYWFETERECFPESFGVCDSPQQFMAKFFPMFLCDPRFEYVTSLVQVSKSNQSSTGGWRWHKWGPYVGDQQPQCEYLFDEPIISEVYTYHVYRRKVPNV